MIAGIGLKVVPVKAGVEIPARLNASRKQVIRGFPGSRIRVEQQISVPRRLIDAFRALPRRIHHPFASARGRLADIVVSRGRGVADDVSGRYVGLALDLRGLFRRVALEYTSNYPSDGSRCRADKLAYRSTPPKTGTRTNVCTLFSLPQKYCCYDSSRCFHLPRSAATRLFALQFRYV